VGAAGLAEQPRTGKDGLAVSIIVDALGYIVTALFACFVMGGGMLALCGLMAVVIGGREYEHEKELPL
jgi:hypothetical protein